MRPRLLAALVVAFAAVAAPAASAAPTATDLASVAADAPIAAYGGWVAWSETRPDGTSAIVTWHDGVKADLPVAPRTSPFDLDIGPDAQGRPTITFSRCVQEADSPAVLLWSSAQGCRLRAVTLPGGRERPVALPRPPAGASDSAPSVWGSRIAFQRRTANADVSQLMMYDFRTHRMTTLRHGSVPHDCPYATGCPKATYKGEASALDLGRRVLAFSWLAQVPSGTGVGGAWELWAERIADRRTVLAGNGYVSGACGGRVPFSPSATADGVLFLSRWYHCESVEGTVTATTFAAGGLLSRTSDVGGAVAWRIARDAATGAVYAVLGPVHRDTQTPLPAGSLRLARVDGLALEKTGKRASKPFVTG